MGSRLSTSGGGGASVPSAPDATTTTTGVVQVDANPTAGHPVAVTTPRIGAVAGVAGLDGSAHVPLAQLSGLGPAQMSGEMGTMYWMTVGV